MRVTVRVGTIARRGLSRCFWQWLLNPPQPCKPLECATQIGMLWHATTCIFPARGQKLPRNNQKLATTELVISVYLHIVTHTGSSGPNICCCCIRDLVIPELVIQRVDCIIYIILWSTMKCETHSCLVSMPDRQNASTCLWNKIFCNFCWNSKNTLTLQPELFFHMVSAWCIREQYFLTRRIKLKC